MLEPKLNWNQKKTPRLATDSKLFSNMSIFDHVCARLSFNTPHGTHGCCISSLLFIFDKNTQSSIAVTVSYWFGLAVVEPAVGARIGGFLCVHVCVWGCRADTKGWWIASHPYVISHGPSGSHGNVTNAGALYVLWSTEKRQMASAWWFHVLNYAMWIHGKYGKDTIYLIMREVKDGTL